MELKLHNREELMKCFINRLKEELIDIDTYNTLYESLKAHGMYDDAAEIEEIARDEFEHAETLHEILEEHGHDVSNEQDIAALWHKAKSAFHLT